MKNLHIRDILLKFEGDDLSKYGLFPLFIWYLVDYVQLLKRLKPLTVKRKRNNKNPIKRRKPTFTEAQLGIGIICIILLGIKRLRKINRLLKTETQIARLIGLERFFDQVTAHRFLNEFQLWHLRQLEMGGLSMEWGGIRCIIHWIEVPNLQTDAYETVQGSIFTRLMLLLIKGLNLRIMD